MSKRIIIFMKKIKNFFFDLGFSSDIFYDDLFYYFPRLSHSNSNELSYEDCLAFIDFITTPKIDDKDIFNVFKTLDKNGIGHITTVDVLNLLRK